MISIVRPLKGPLRIRLPYRPKYANRSLLEQACESHARVKYIGAGTFTAPRSRLRQILDAIRHEFHQSVILELHGATQTSCDYRCWSANPDTWMDCECHCAGSNHGSGAPFETQPSPTFSIHTDYTVSRTIIPPQDS